MKQLIPIKYLYFKYADQQPILVHRHFGRLILKNNTNGSLCDETIEFVILKDKKDIWHETNDEYDKWFDKQEKIILSRNNIPDEIWYEKFNSKEQVIVWPEKG